MHESAFHPYLQSGGAGLRVFRVLPNDNPFVRTGRRSGPALSWGGFISTSGDRYRVTTFGAVNDQAIMTGLRQTFRSLLSAPAFTAIVIVTLAIAIGANSAIFSVLNGVVLKPLPYDAPDQLIMVWEANPAQSLPQEPTSAATFVDWREQATSFQEMAAFRYRGFTLTLDGGVPQRIASAEVTPSLFRVLRTEPALGRTFTADEEAPGNERLVILSDGAWRTRLGADADIIGRTIPLDGVAHEVVGVMPPGFTFPIGDTEVEAWSPLTLSLDNLASRPHRGLSTIGRLGDASTLEGARSEMSMIAGQIAEDYPDSNQGWTVTLVSAEEQLVGDTDSTVWILFGAVTLVLLIGCVNVANLLLVRSGDRNREMAVHAAFGARATDLVKRAMSEGLVLGVFGGLAGLVVAWLLVSVLRSVLPVGFPRLDDVRLDPIVLGFTAIVSLVAAVLFSLAPALRSVRPDISSILQRSARGSSLGRGSRRAANAMVVAQVALALVLTVGAGLLLRSYAELAAVDPGYRTEDVVAVAIELPPSRYGQMADQQTFFVDLMSRLRSIPGVEAVGAVSYLPMSPIGTEFDMPFTVEGLEASSPSQRPTAEYRGVFPGYFEAMDIDLVAGRMLDERDGTDDHRVALINETVVRRYFADRDPIGQMLEMPMLGNVEIVGVVEDIRHDGLGVEANAEMYVPFVRLALPALQVVAYAPGESTDVVSAIRQRILEIDPALPITRVNRISDLLSSSIAPSRFNMVLLVGLATSAVLLSLVGVYGVVSYTVSRRTQELGVRLALGADAGSMIRLVLGQAAGLVVLGVIAGVVVALGSARVVEGLLYGVEPLDVPTFTAVPIGLVVIAMIAAALPAMKVGRIDPVIALRKD